MMWMDVDVALTKVPVNACPLISDSDFKTIQTSVAYNASGMALYWHFVTTAGVETTTQVTPTTAGTYDWAHAGQGMYTIEIPASGGASINNDSEGFGYFTGFATGVLPWRGPTIGFRAAGLNDLLIDSAFSATRGLAGTALPNAAADAPGGLPISDAGGLDLDAKLANTNEVTAARMGVLTDWIDGGRLDVILDARASQTSVDDVPTNAELATALGTADDAVLAQVALVKAKTDNLPSDPADQSIIIAATDAILTAVGDVPTNAELATALGTADDATLAQIALVKAKTDLIPADPADASDIAASFASIATAVADLPTNAELATALASADDAVLAAVAGLNNLTAAQVVTALRAWAVETGVTFETVVKALAASVGGDVTGDGTEYAAIGNPGTPRISVDTADIDGNRTVTVTG